MFKRAESNERLFEQVCVWVRERESDQCECKQEKNNITRNSWRPAKGRETRDKYYKTIFAIIELT